MARSNKGFRVGGNKVAIHLVNNRAGVIRSSELVGTRLLFIW
jgi:hypothetical protein